MGKHDIAPHHRGRLTWWERLPWIWHRRLDGTRWCGCSRSRLVAAARAEETINLPRHIEYGLWQIMRHEDRRRTQ